mmetsp:Transcript_29910/g.64778  ORF Transcript_29910/g.64778 Transcript_29910/m.64778 type:complete len:112 (+) Transcript_29910:1613-1948(+)
MASSSYSDEIFQVQEGDASKEDVVCNESRMSCERGHAQRDDLQSEECSNCPQAAGLAWEIRRSVCLGWLRLCLPDNCISTTVLFTMVGRLLRVATPRQMPYDSGHSTEFVH